MLFKDMTIQAMGNLDVLECMRTDFNVRSDESCRMTFLTANPIKSKLFGIVSFSLVMIQCI